MPHPSLRRGRALRRFDHGASISAIDTRPMMFVALFIAVVFLLAASQMRTHTLLVSLPAHQPQVEDGSVGGPDRLTITIGMTAKGSILFNGTAVSADQLRAFLHEAKRLTPEPAILFEPDGAAPYGEAAQTLAIIHQAGMIGGLFCLDGLELHQNFGRGGGAPFPLLLSIVPPNPRIQPPPIPAKFESCAPEQLASDAWMF